MLFKINFIFFCLIIGILTSCSTNSEKLNDRLNDKLNSRIKAGKFEEIYKRSSSVLRAKMSESEFVAKMKKATEKMKQVDSDLKWKKSKKTSHDWTDHAYEYSSRYMESGDKRINLEIWWLDNTTLCRFGMFSNFGDKENDFRTPDCT